MFLAAATPATTTTSEPGVFQTILDTVATRGVDIGLMVVGAIVAWIVGNWIIRLVVRLINKMLDGRHVDHTLGRYLSTSVGMVLRVMLVVAILGIFGIETTSFAALFAAVGVAIGMAWSGLLSNFAAGVFMVVLRPIKVGDFVSVAGVTGTVREIGIFVTAIDTPDNVRTIIGNSKVFGDIMSNYSTNSVRRVDLVAQLAHSVDYKKAIELLRARLPNVPHVAKDPAPTVEILEFTTYGPVLCVRPYTHNDTYWDVYFATNQLISDTFGQAGFPVPQTHVNVVHKAG